MAQWKSWYQAEAGEDLGSVEYRVTEEMVRKHADDVEDHDPWFLEDSPFGGPIAHPTITANFREVIDEIGILRPSNGMWYLDVDGNGYWSEGDQWLGTFGGTGDQAVAGDWDGDGTDEIGIFRPSNGIWYLDVDGNGYWSGGDQWLGIFGQTGDQAVAGDWDGDGTDEIGIFRPSNGMWYLDVDGNGYWSEGDQYLGTFGATGDQAVAGDWDAL